MSNILKALREASDGAGGYLVPEEFSARLLQLVQEKTVIVPDLDTVQMNTDTLHIPKTTSGTTAYWVSETNTISSSEMGFDRTDLTPKKVAARVNASTELLEDANVSVANSIMDQMSRDLAIKIDSEILGTSNTNLPGLRYTGSYTNSVSAGDGGASGGTIQVKDVSNAMDEVMADNHMSPDVAYFHSKVIGDLRNLTDGNGRPLLNVETYGSPLIENGSIGTIYGAIVKKANTLPINLSYGTGSAATASDAIVGIKKQFGYYAVRRGLTAHRDYDIDTDMNQYQVNMRVAFNVKYPDAYCVIKAIHI